jgi:hypothetical protein
MSPSPLKRASPSRRSCFSPELRTDSPTSRKLNLPFDEAPGHPRLEDAIPAPCAVPVVVIEGLKATVASENQTRSLRSKAATSVTVLPLRGGQPRPSQSAGIRRSPSAEGLLKQRIPIEPSRSLLPKATATPLPHTKNLPATMTKPPLRGSRSHSASQAPESTRRSKRKATVAQSLSIFDAWAAISNPNYTERQRVILRGLAKLKAEEAAKVVSAKSDK